MTNRLEIPPILPNYDDPSPDPSKRSLPWNTMFGALALSIPLCAVLYSLLINASWLLTGVSREPAESFATLVIWNLVGLALILFVVVGVFAVVLGIPIVIAVEAALRRVTSRRLHLLAHFAATAIVAGVLVALRVIPGYVILGGGGWDGTPNVWQTIAIIAVFAVITGGGAALSWLSADAIARRRAARAIRTA